MAEKSISKPRELLQLIIEDWTEIRKFTTCSWAKQQQFEMLTMYERLCSEIDAAIAGARERGGGDEASEWRAGQTLLKSVVCELQMWLALKESDAWSAWHSFCDAEQYAVNARRWLPQSFEPAKDQVEHLRLVERIAFPYPAFFTSIAVLVGREVCTICESEYGTCAHLAGELYDGEMCARRCEEIKEALHLALVRNPSDKRLRLREPGGIDPPPRAESRPKKPRRAKSKRKRRR